VLRFDPQHPIWPLAGALVASRRERRGMP